MLSVCKLFFSRTTEPNQSNFAQSKGWMGFNFFKGPPPFLKGVFGEIVKIHLWHLTTQFHPNLAQSILQWREFNFNQMKGHALFQGEIIKTFHQPAWMIIALLQHIYCWEMFLRRALWPMGLWYRMFQINEVKRRYIKQMTLIHVVLYLSSITGPESIGVADSLLRCCSHIPD